MPRAEVKKIPPLSIYAFRKIDQNQNVEVPELARNRKLTDVPCLIFFLLSILAIAIVSALTGANTDVNRFFNGHDKCGDTCGSVNRPISVSNCSGKNLIEEPFMLYQSIIKKKKVNLLPDACVGNCSKPNRLFFHRCIPENQIKISDQANYIMTYAEFFGDVQKAGFTLIVPMIFTGLVLAVDLVLCFHCWTAYTLWAVVIVTAICSLTFTAYVWVWYFYVGSTNLLYIGIFITIMIIFVSILLCYFHEKYALLIEMFTEATRATSKVFGLRLVPVVILVILFVLFGTVTWSGVVLSTNESMEKLNENPTIYGYVQTNLSYTCVMLLIFMMIWLVSFANGCQCIIVAGPVSSYYFQRDKKIRFSVLKSCYILFRYHLGTVAFGSFCITIVTAIRIILNFLQDRVKCRYGSEMMECCLIYLEQMVEYFTKRAYIQTAMHGRGLYRSGVRAARLLWANLMDTISLDVVGDFIMSCAALMVVLISIWMGLFFTNVQDLNITYLWTMLAIGGIFVSIIVFMFTQIINIAVETIFLCFCEDKVMNDGKTRPYFMSQHLQEIINKARKIQSNPEVSII